MLDRVLPIKASGTPCAAAAHDTGALGCFTKHMKIRLKQRESAYSDDVRTSMPMDKESSSGMNKIFLPKSNMTGRVLSKDNIT